MMKTKSLILNSFILSIPGIISIFISLLAIPIHLKINGLENYGKYIFFHFVLTLGVILNFGIGKITTILINKKPSKKKFIIFESIKYSLVLSFIIFVFGFLINTILNLNYNYFIFGISLTIIFISLESIMLGVGSYKASSFYNFIYYSLSVNLPSISLSIYNLDLYTLIKLSLFIKCLAIVLLFMLILKKIKINSEIHLLIKLKENSFWIFLSNLSTQVSEFSDKYLIKAFLGSSYFGTYSIPQQLTGKLSIFSKGFSAYLLKTLSNKKNDDSNLILSLNIFIIFLPLLIFISLPLLKWFLIIWLNENYNSQIFHLLKIFSIASLFTCGSHLITSKFESSFKTKQSFLIDVIYLLPYIFLLSYLVIANYSLELIGSLILIKETFIFVSRLIYFKNNLKKDLWKLIIVVLLILHVLFFSFVNNLIYTVLLIIFAILTINEFYKFYSKKNI